MAGFAGAVTIIGSALVVLFADHPGRGADEVKTTIARRDPSTADELVAQLERVPLLDVASMEQAIQFRQAQVRFAALRKEKQKRGGETSSEELSMNLAFRALETERTKLCATLGLPVREEKQRQLEAKEAEHLETAAGLLRQLGVVSVPGRRGGDMDRPKIKSWSQLQQAVWLIPGKGGLANFERALIQMLQAEDEAQRTLLVEALSHVGDAADVGLAERAVYDTSPTVRAAAIEALRIRSDRPPEVFRDVLLQALRHPWPPVADHATEALVALRDREALPMLKRLADEPDPNAPLSLAKGKTKPLVREVVRVNHLRNCLLCHAPVSSDVRNLVLALVPTPGQPLPVAYYADRGGDGVFVRADIPYLKQDFSMTQKVEGAKPWPSQQRFDFLVRTREATTAEEVAAVKKALSTYPQREAVLWAIKELEKLAVVPQP
jgi:hypothetical protein